MTAPYAATPSLSAVFGTSAKQLTDNLGPTIGAIAVWGLGTMLVGYLIDGLTGGFGAASIDSSSAGGEVAGTLLNGLLLAVAISCTMTGFFRIARGRQARFADFFTPTALIPIVIANLIVSAVVAVVTVVIGTGSLTQLLISSLASLVVSVFFLWSQVYAAGAGLGGVQALTASARLTIARPATTAAVFAITVALTILGIIGFVIALVFTVPLAALILVNYFRALTGEVDFSLS